MQQTDSIIPQLWINQANIYGQHPNIWNEHQARLMSDPHLMSSSEHIPFSATSRFHPYSNSGSNWGNIQSPITNIPLTSATHGFSGLSEAPAYPTPAIHNLH